PSVIVTARRSTWRRLRPRRDISADSAPPPERISYSCGVRCGSIVMTLISSSVRWPTSGQQRQMVLEVEIDVLPGPDPLPAGAAEETAGDHRHGEVEGENAEEGNRELAVLERPAGVAIYIGQQNQHQRYSHDRHQHTSDGRREVVELLLQAQKVPGR